MALIVHKYGGTSVGSAERIKNVATRVAKWHQAGHQLVVVVSAMSGETNRLIGLAKQIQAEPDPRELDVIAADVLGGTSLMGGKGTIIGTALGALTIAVIGNGLILSHVSPFFTQIVTGFIILVAIWLNTRVFARLAAPVRKT